MNLDELRRALDLHKIEEQLPILGRLKQTGRDIALEALKLVVQVYDPAPPRAVAILGPDYRALGIDLDGSPRLEDALNERSAIQVESVDNERIVRSCFDFGYQPYEEPRLLQLRQQYQLSEVADPGESELERMILLRSWARSQFRRNDWQPRIDNFDAVTILERDYRNTDGRENDKSVNYTPCSFFPPLFIQVMLSMGYQARYVSISHEGLEFHGMTEVWSHQHRKWVTMDADLNLYYQRDGVPLNLLEVHDLRYAPDPLRFDMVRGEQSSGDDLWREPLPGPKDFFVSYHSYFRTELRNDWLTNYYFPGHPKRSDKITLYWVDGRREPPPTRSPKTDQASDFYWTLDQAEIRVEGGGSKNPPSCLPLLFDTVTPNFDRFEVVVDDGEPIASSSPRFEWVLHEGRNTISVIPVNKLGVRGIASSATLVVS